MNFFWSVRMVHHKEDPDAGVTIGDGWVVESVNFSAIPQLAQAHSAATLPMPFSCVGVYGDTYLGELNVAGHFVSEQPVSKADVDFCAAAAMYAVDGTLRGVKSFMKDFRKVGV